MICSQYFLLFQLACVYLYVVSNKLLPYHTATAAAGAAGAAGAADIVDIFDAAAINPTPTPAAITTIYCHYCYYYC